MALALGLSFGLGGRETAGMIVRHFYERNCGSPGQVAHGPSLGAREGASRVAYTGVEHRHALGNRHSSPNGRRAAT